MSNLLVIDTSSAVCTVALVQPVQNKVRQLEGARSHGQFLLSAIHEITTQANIELASLDALAVVSGPGSFTGIRIGVGVIQGLATALNIPVILLSSLEWLACTAVEQYKCSAVLVCCTARDSEYYTGFFTRNQEHILIRAGDEQVATAGQVRIPDDAAGDNIVAVGDGWMDRDAFDRDFLSRFSVIDAEIRGCPDKLCELALRKKQLQLWVSADQALPSYLKENMYYKSAT